MPMSSISKCTFKSCSLPNFQCHQLNVVTLGAYIVCCIYACLRPPTCESDALMYIHHDPAQAETGPQNVWWYQHACRDCSNWKVYFTAHSQQYLCMHAWRDADL